MCSKIFLFSSDERNFFVGEKKKNLKRKKIVNIFRLEWLGKKIFFLEATRDYFMFDIRGRKEKEEEKYLEMIFKWMEIFEGTNYWEDELRIFEFYWWIMNDDFGYFWMYDWFGMQDMRFSYELNHFCELLTRLLSFVPHISLLHPICRHSWVFVHISS